jgi:hypothetical protein
MTRLSNVKVVLFLSRTRKTGDDVEYFKKYFILRANVCNKVNKGETYFFMVIYKDLFPHLSSRSLELAPPATHQVLLAASWRVRLLLPAQQTGFLLPGGHSAATCLHSRQIHY